MINLIFSAIVLNEQINKVYEKRLYGVAYLFDLPLLSRRSMTKARRRNQNSMIRPKNLLAEPSTLFVPDDPREARLDNGSRVVREATKEALSNDHESIGTGCLSKNRHLFVCNRKCSEDEVLQSWDPSGSVHNTSVYERLVWGTLVVACWRKSSKFNVWMTK